MVVAGRVRCTGVVSELWTIGHWDVSARGLPEPAAARGDRPGRRRSGAAGVAEESSVRTRRVARLAERGRHRLRAAGRAGRTASETAGGRRRQRRLEERELPQRRGLHPRRRLPRGHRAARSAGAREASGAALRRADAVAMPPVPIANTLSASGWTVWHLIGDAPPRRHELGAWGPKPLRDADGRLTDPALLGSAHLSRSKEE